LRQTIGDLVPRRTIVDKRVKLRANPWVVIESSHANRNLIAVRPIAAKQTRATPETKCFHCALSFSVNANQVFSLEQTELLLLDTGLRAHGRAGMLAAAFAMTMTRADEWRLNVETDTAAEATSSNNFTHELLLLRG
jgi:hypothetical protein